MPLPRLLILLLATLMLLPAHAAEPTLEERLSIQPEWSKTWKPAPGEREKGTPLYVAPGGKPGNKGTQDSPWDLESTLGGGHPVPTGSTVWIAAGVYKNPKRGDSDYFTVKGLRGTADKPIHISAARGARVVLDGGVLVQNPCEHLWLWDLEIVVSENLSQTRITKTPGSNVSFNRPNGGLNAGGGKNCKYINLTIHDNTGGGVGFWIPAIDSELYGCLIYDNGTAGPDRTHGHCVYTQNKNGTKIISNCIMTVAKDYGCYTMHAYGSKNAFVQNFTIEENIVYGCDGPKHGPFLVGGGVTDFNIVVRKNLLHDCPVMNLGAYTQANNDCTLSDNWIVNGEMRIQKYETADLQGNHVINGKLVQENVKTLNDKNNAFETKAPAEPVVFVLPNKYDTGRANVAIYNFPNRQRIRVDLSAIARAGHVRLLDPKDFFGKPVFEADIADGAITVPMAAPFKAYVALIDAK